MKVLLALAFAGSVAGLGDFEAETNPCNPYGDSTKQQIWTDLADIPCFSAEDANEVREGEPFILNGVTAFNSNAVQSGRDVTIGHRGELDAALDPVSTRYTETCTDLGCMCPVNVHWHLGAEHYNEGTYDLNGDDWMYQYANDSDEGRRLAGEIQPGNWCPGYDPTDPKYTTPYEWEYCVDMNVGYTYEFHWPHSNLGWCGTEWQFQTHFMDGVLCFANNAGLSTADALDTVFESELTKIGVQAQVFVVVNDDAYDYPEYDMLNSWYHDLATDVAIYQGSTTGLNDGNIVCRGTGGAVTWQVDRGCHLISARKVDDLCRQMLEQKDDMSEDLYPHTARDTVVDALASTDEIGSTDFSPDSPDFP